MFVVHVPSSSEGDSDRDNMSRNKDREAETRAGGGDGSHPSGGIFGTKVECILVLLYSDKHFSLRLSII